MKSWETLIKRVLVESRKDIEWIIVLSSNGDVLGKFSPRDISEETLNEIIKIIKSEILPHNIKHVDIMLEDESHIIIVKKGKEYIVSKTRVKPNLGKIYVILRKIFGGEVSE